MRVDFDVKNSWKLQIFKFIWPVGISNLSQAFNGNFILSHGYPHVQLILSQTFRRSENTTYLIRCPVPETIITVSEYFRLSHMIQSHFKFNRKIPEDLISVHNALKRSSSVQRIVISFIVSFSLNILLCFSAIYLIISVSFSCNYGKTRQVDLDRLYRIFIPLSFFYFSVVC